MDGLLTIITTSQQKEVTRSEEHDSKVTMSSVNSPYSKLYDGKNDLSEDDDLPMQRIKKKIKRFTDSDSENDDKIVSKNNETVQYNSTDSESKDDSNKKSFPKSRIQLYNSESDSQEETAAAKNLEQQMRMKNKRNKIKLKFKGLLDSRDKHSVTEKIGNKSSNTDTENSEGEITSIKTIKQKLRESMSHIPSICDPDISDEEIKAVQNYPNKPKQKKQRKATILTSPKPIRMSAKQAMENMQKIKSESNRMLREKEVSLPYHRPKALSLKDIMSRRKPAVTADGKALPIKMNEEQLKQYAQLLEQRQKEMMELCKSDTEEETEPEHETKELCPEEEKKGGGNIQINNCVENEIFDHSIAKSVVQICGEKVVANNLTNTDISEEPDVLEIDTTNKEIQLIDSNEDNDDGSSGDEEHSTLDPQILVDKCSDINIIEEESTTDDNKTEHAIVDLHEGVSENAHSTENNSEIQVFNVGTEPESQLINLHYDTEKSEKCSEELEVLDEPDSKGLQDKQLEGTNVSKNIPHEDFLSDDDDINMDEIDKIIENADIVDNSGNIISTSKIIKGTTALNIKPKLTGAPGMVIDLDESDPCAAKKLSGIELLKERFTYFAKLKTPEELEREREKKVKPGAQHQKLKQDLEEKIAEQRSLEWAKRLEEEKEQQIEANAIRGDTSDVDDDIEKIEAKLEEINEKDSSSSSENEDDLVEDDVEMQDKPLKRNPMLDDQAEESECDENMDTNQDGVEKEDEEAANDEIENEEDSEDESSDDDSSESESEQTAKPKKGRILKAFEDSDDEDIANNDDTLVKEITEKEKIDTISTQTTSQDDEIQLAQTLKSMSEDLFSSQDVASTTSTKKNSNKDESNTDDVEITTQTFSILDSKPSNADFKSLDEIGVLSVTQPYHDPSLAALASGLSQNLPDSQMPTQFSQSQAIGEDLLALCTGQFYNNEFISQSDETEYVETQESCNEVGYDKVNEICKEPVTANLDENTASIKEGLVNNIKSVDIKRNDTKQDTEQGNLLKSILDELDDPEFDAPKPNKYFTGASQKKETDKNMDNSQLKKKFIIDSDDETDATEQLKKKKNKRKRDKRALHISDDEEDEQEQLEDEELEELSDLEEDTEKIVEYDSEENEIEINPVNPKMKRKTTDFFEQEAELSSEDEWVGSGDEDEAGLDRMEREAGDDDVFHQGKLRRELGQIHMRDVLDQDKREVRILQELLFEDGDLGAGHRQRKFRWRNADGSEEVGTMVDEFGDTQEDEFESEEQWRKQRHEREVFLRQMQNKEEDNLNVSVNRTTIIKANLSSRTMSSLLLEMDQSKNEQTDSPPLPEKKTAKDIPSPKKSFAILQQNYHGSLLTRGRGALARLAALATPLAADDDAPKIGSLAPSSKRNFVFAALTPDAKPKVTTKRKADGNTGTPKLVKKMRTEEKPKTKSSLLDHLKAL